MLGKLMMVGSFLLLAGCDNLTVGGSCEGARIDLEDRWQCSSQGDRAVCEDCHNDPHGKVCTRVSCSSRLVVRCGDGGIHADTGLDDASVDMSFDDASLSTSFGDASMDMSLDTGAFCEEGE